MPTELVLVVVLPAIMSVAMSFGLEFTVSPGRPRPAFRHHMGAWMMWFGAFMIIGFGIMILGAIETQLYAHYVTALLLLTWGVLLMVGANKCYDH